MRLVPVAVLVIVSVVLSACTHQSSPVTFQAPVVSSPPANVGSPESSESSAQTAAYVDFSEAALTRATAQSGKAVLFFHAAWCPTCQAADKALTARLNELPATVTVLKVDYDSSTDLKKKYGITYQHTYVQVDAQGNELAKWNGGDIDEISNRIK